MCSSVRHTPMRPTAQSTLFPYTTLFRSAKKSPGRGERGSETLQINSMGMQKPIREGLARHRKRVLRRRPRGRHEADRKSTRLNSSHLGISYAVFCLKKKKEYRHRTRGRD